MMSHACFQNIQMYQVRHDIAEILLTLDIKQQSVNMSHCQYQWKLLHWHCTRKVLWLKYMLFVFLFWQAGPLEKVKIATDKDGRLKNFAFVTFKHACSVPFTIDLMSGIQLYGYNLKLQARTGIFYIVFSTHDVLSLISYPFC